MRRLSVYALLLLILIVSPLASAKSTDAVISGLVRVASEDERGNVTSVEILVGDEEEPYLVANNEKGKELLLYIGQYVLAGGTVEEDELGWKTIKVKHYALTSDYPDR